MDTMDRQAVSKNGTSPFYRPSPSRTGQGSKEEVKEGKEGTVGRSCDLFYARLYALQTFKQS